MSAFCGYLHNIIFYVNIIKPVPKKVKWNFVKLILCEVVTLPSKAQVSGLLCLRLVGELVFGRFCGKSCPFLPSPVLGLGAKMWRKLCILYDNRSANQQPWSSFDFKAVACGVSTITLYYFFTKFAEHFIRLRDLCRRWNILRPDADMTTAQCTSAPPAGLLQNTPWCTARLHNL